MDHTTRTTRSQESEIAGVQGGPGGAAPEAAVQQVVKVRRDYNRWVATETLEDYALRYTPQRARRWSEWGVAHTAFGAASFLVLEAVGATLLVQYGFINAFWAIVCTGVIIFAAGLPISIYAARHGVDMDLLTRGAGFGYIGSSITSLIYASFTFIFFALEAAVMAYALELALDIPPRWGYLVCALVVIPLVTHGVSAISRLQVWTQPLWLLMLVVPFVYVLVHQPGVFADVLHYPGADAQRAGQAAGFSLPLFGAGLTMGIALITQMGEQADYLRFMPVRTQAHRWRWWGAVMLGGPGWVLLGVAKMLGGALLAYLAISQAVPPDHAVDPNQMYLAAYGYVFPQYGWAVAATALFVVLSQLKINVTNAYAGSLAWSNFFSRLTHSHPGRVVWVVFNTLIAFMLMEMHVFRALGEVLGLYSNLAIAWIMAVVADLVINKPLGLSPRGIEFKRARLYDINPVGVGAMALSSLLSVAAHLGAFGPLAQAFSALIAMGVALVASPVIAWWTGGRYYLVPAAPAAADAEAAGAAAADAAAAGAAPASCAGCTAQVPGPPRLQRCVVCERDYEVPDMVHCPAYQGAICSLCCTLDARCGDLCRPQAHLAVQWRAALRRLLPQRMWRLLDKGLLHFVLLMLMIVPALAALIALLYLLELQTLARSLPAIAAAHAQVVLQTVLLKVGVGLLLIAGLVVWWLVLAQHSRKVAQQESQRQTGLLVREIALHRATDGQLQQARRAAEEARAVAEAARQAADLANQAKSRYISAISHELRTPLNSILGYAQLMGEDPEVPAHRRQAVAVIRRGGEHLLSLIEGTLDIARIESGKLALQVQPMEFAAGLQQMAGMFELQAEAKGLVFHYEPEGSLPAWVRTDEKRLRQILFNLLGNAIKFTARGTVTLRVRHTRQMAYVSVLDTGPGLSEAEQAQVFEPFARGSGAQASAGAGLGLTMAKMLTELMGGALSVSSQPGQGAAFHIRLFLPSLEQGPAALPAPPRAVGYLGATRRLLVVDNEEADRELLAQLLVPLGFALQHAADGQEALALLAAGYRPQAIFMDLAMPGMDGWECLRRLRQMPLGEVACAIVSANAFDRELPNDVGIRPQDFLVKPVRHSELLQWLEDRLELVWRSAPLRQPLPLTRRTQDSAGGLDGVPAAALTALRQAIAWGYVRGVEQALAQLAQDYPQAAPAWRQLQAQAQQFQFEAMAEQLQEHGAEEQA